MPTISPLAYTKLIHHSYKHPTQPITGLLISTSNSPHLISDAIPLDHGMDWQELLVEMMMSGDRVVRGAYYGGGSVKDFDAKKIHTGEEENNEAQEDGKVSGVTHDKEDGEQVSDTDAEQSGDDMRSLSQRNRNGTQHDDDSMDDMHVTYVPSKIRQFLAQIDVDTPRLWVISNHRLRKDELNKSIAVQEFYLQDGQWATVWGKDMRFDADVYGWKFEWNGEVLSEQRVCEAVVKGIEEGWYEAIVDGEDHMDNVSLDWRNKEYEENVSF